MPLEFLGFIGKFGLLGWNFFQNVEDFTSLILFATLHPGLKKHDRKSVVATVWASDIFCTVSISFCNLQNEENRKNNHLISMTILNHAFTYYDVHHRKAICLFFKIQPEITKIFILSVKKIVQCVVCPPYASEHIFRIKQNIFKRNFKIQSILRCFQWTDKKFQPMFLMKRIH